ncbi:MerR family transcriptional regulator [Nonomuraea sp. NPDC050310]|uniref:MerR family transcriptional regulator n=1 Tax=Nonomuraea sp. NPDC050310 TaxID=3154935 RepID=UPI0034091619
MDLLPIGELARRAGLSVKTVRFYADRGLVPPTTRTAAGHRLYDAVALDRLELVRTLRDLGLDLATIHRIVTRQVSLTEVAALHAEALAVQIQALRVRQAILTRVARHGTAPEEMDMTHRLATMAGDERRALIAAFLDHALDGVPEGVRTTMTPVLPDDPSPEQVEAWIELALLATDPGFRDRLRSAVAPYAVPPTSPPRPDPAALVRRAVAPALAAGLDPRSPEAAAVPLPEVDLDRLETVLDPDRDRYLELLAIINGWPAPEPLAPALAWALARYSATASSR